MRFYLEGRRTGDFEEGIRLALQSILVSPLLRVPAGTGAGTDGLRCVYRIADLNLASRLSFFVWGTGPDHELITAARRDS